MNPEAPSELVANARQALTVPDMAEADRLTYPAATIARVVALLDEAIERMRAPAVCVERKIIVQGFIEHGCRLPYGHHGPHVCPDCTVKWVEPDSIPAVGV